MITGASTLYGSASRSGAVICEMQGGLGCDTYVDIVGGSISVLRTEEYNYEAFGYVDAKEGIWNPLDSYQVHDYTPLS